MNKIFFDTKSMQTIGFFEKNTNAKVKDCIIQDKSILFIVEPNEMGRAIGKNGINIKKLENAFKKKIKVIEFSSEVKTFIKNLITPSQIKEIVYEEGLIKIIPLDSKTRGYIIGKNATMLRKYEEITKRYFPIKEIKIK